MAVNGNPRKLTHTNLNDPTAYRNTKKPAIEVLYYPKIKKQT